MKNTIIAVALYVSFYGCIAVACWVTKSGWPLLAMALVPNLKINNN